MVYFNLCVFVFLFFVLSSSVLCVLWFASPTDCRLVIIVGDLENNCLYIVYSAEPEASRALLYAWVGKHFDTPDGSRSRTAFGRKALQKVRLLLALCLWYYECIVVLWVCLGFLCVIE